METRLTTNTDFTTRFPDLTRTVRWRNTALTGCRLVTGAPDTSRLQSVNMVPFVGDRVIVISQEDGNIMLPGGTRELGETLLETISREMIEETGYTLGSCYPYAVLECISCDEKPWREHLVHPEFERLVCFGEVRYLDAPTNPDDAEQIDRVDLLAIDQADRFLRHAGRPELADIYRLAFVIRSTQHELIDLCV